MKYAELVILLPCHGLEDFPVHHVGAAAEGLLSCWSALWHPALVAAADSKPTWCRVDDPPPVLANRLLVIPDVSQPQVPSGLLARATAEGARVVCGLVEREAVIQAALESLEGDGGTADPELVADFLALGFCYLQIQLLTRQMRYASNLDEIYFSRQLVTAARAAIGGRENDACDGLASCFNVLAQERDHYYPVDVFLLDLTLVAATTLGPSLRRELDRSPVPVNLLLPAGLLPQSAHEQPETLRLLRTALDQGTLSVVGGEADQYPTPLLSSESLLSQLQQGLELYERYLGSRPTVYGRRRYGLGPAWPHVLRQLGFTAALHATLDDGHFPQGAQSKTLWQGSHGTGIDALTRAPLDATRPETFLGFAVGLGESMDRDHVATRCLAHWPGQQSRWYGDLRRIARHVSALGKFVTFEQYFRQADHFGHLDRFHADQYRSPYLKQAAARGQIDPLGTTVRYWRRRGQVDGLAGLAAVATLLGTEGASAAEGWSQRDQLARTADAMCEDDSRDGLAWDAQAAARWDEALAAVAERMCGEPGDRSPKGWLVLNPCSFARRIAFESPPVEPAPEAVKPIYAAALAGGRTHVVVDVPALGFAWVGAGSQADRRAAEPAVADGNVLRNEYMQVTIDPTTGALRTLHDYHTRGNRLSQQLALRMPASSQRPDEVWSDDGPAARYSVMAADELRVVVSSSAVGEIAVRGRLLDEDGAPLADFQQTYRLWRGRRVLELEIELVPHREPQPDPWNWYYGCRFAWSDESAELHRGVHGVREATDARRIVAPQYVEINAGAARTAVLTGGLPYHRRVGLRMLDCLLIVPGESTRRFRIGVAIDAAYPLQEALAWQTPPAAVHVPAPRGGKTSGWLAHLDSRNVVVTSWEPIVEDDRAVGLRLRLMETEGRASSTRIALCRRVATASKVDLGGRPVDDCPMDDAGVRVEMAEREWAQVEVRWRT